MEEGSNWKKEIFNAEMENSPEKQKIRIKLENLGYSYGKRGKKVFCSLNGVIFQGEITLIAGRSGTGKSTLLELIAGIVPSKEINDSLSGEVAYYGFSYGKRGSPMEEGRILLTKEIGEKELKSLRNRTAILFQNVERQLFAMTVKEEIEYNIMKRYGIKDRNSEELNSRTGDVVRMFGFTEEFLMKSPFRLSSGEKKLLGIALAVCRDSEILILDEVVASLDYSNTIRIMEIIRNVVEKGTAVIISSSDTGTISGYVDSILHLEGGHDEVSEDNKDGYYRENHADQGRGNSISLSANENARFHNLDPRIRIVSSILLLILVILTSFYRKDDFICYYSVILAFLVCQALLSGVSIIKLAKRIRVYVYTTAVLTFFNFFFMQSGRLLVNSRLLKIYDTPLLFSLNAGYQIVLIALVSEILIETTGPDKIIKGIGYLMGRKGKSSAVGLMFTFSLSFLPLIREEGKRIFIAQKSRGAEFRRMSVESMREILMLIIPLFRLSLERVMKIYETMAVKNFIPDGEITEYRPLKLGSRDYIHSFMMISFSILYLIWLFVF